MCFSCITVFDAALMVLDDFFQCNGTFNNAVIDMPERLFAIATT
jgi:hypothetical protein